MQPTGIATNRKINDGEVITESDIHMLSPGDGFKWRDKSSIIGKKIITSIEKDEIIYSHNLKTI